MPPSLGYKPRKYCCAKCAKGRPAKQSLATCRICHCEIQQDEHSRGRGRTICDSRACRNASKRTKKKPVRCTRCGDEFLSSNSSAMYCSKRCRWQKQLTDRVPCKECGDGFVRGRHDQKYCSHFCVSVARSRHADATVARNVARGRVCNCLNCGKDYHPKNGLRLKYCSRGCAFEARRLKKKCAERPSEIAKRVAKWFLSWGDDYWPHVYKCGGCGGKMIQRNEGVDKPSLCVNCRPVRRECVDCGSTELSSFCVRCEPCAESRRRMLRGKQRRKSRRLRGHESSFRSRCRNHNAPYTPIDKRLILERGGWECQLCSSPLLDRHTINDDGSVAPNSPTLDHVFPLELGPDGPGHVHYNVVGCCFECNSLKGSLDPEGWACSLTPALDSFAADNAPRLDYKAWLKAQHQRRSTSSSYGDRKKRSTVKN